MQETSLSKFKIITATFRGIVDQTAKYRGLLYAVFNKAIELHAFIKKAL
jgi:phosphoribosylamine-glycine ligase